MRAEEMCSMGEMSLEELIISVEEISECAGNLA